MREKISFDKNWLFHRGDVEYAAPTYTGYAVMNAKTELLSVDLWGLYVKPQYQGEENWTVRTAVTLRNDFVVCKRAKVVCTLLDSDGKEVATASAGGLVRKKDKAELVCNMLASAPKRWSPSAPTLYTMRAGRIGLAVALKEGVGELKVTAHAEGLQSAVFKNVLNKRRGIKNR